MRQLAAYLLVFAGVCWPTTGDRGRFELSVFLHDVLLLDIFHSVRKTCTLRVELNFNLKARFGVFRRQRVSSRCLQ